MQRSNLLDNADRQGKFFDQQKIWISVEFPFKINDLLNELVECLRDEWSYNKSSGVFAYKGSFLRIATILNRINASEMNITNLKMVKIFATHSLIFDSDLVLSKFLYETHSPDLMVIAPKIHVITNTTSKIQVNLSCLTMPNNTLKASDGEGLGKNGIDGIDGLDGLPGESGFNGGSFVVITNEPIENEYNLDFVSNGGKGGKGQNGKLNFLYCSITTSYL